jgi:hypothetical protein
VRTCRYARCRSCASRSPTYDGPVEVEGVVVWRHLEDIAAADPLPPGCGIRFSPLSIENERRIRALVDGLATVQ